MPAESVVLSLGANGRLLLPSILRQHLNLSEGDRLLIQIEENGDCVKMAKLSDEITAAERLYQSFATPESVVDELIAERREQAAKE